MDKNWQLRGFPLMKDIIPERQVGDYRTEHFAISESEASLYVTRSIYNFDFLGRQLKAGDFCRLKRNGSMLMSDGGGERWSNVDIVREAHGNVLIAGLGIGMILTTIAPKPEVKRITVVEIAPEVIHLIEPHIKTYLGKHADKLEIVQADIYDFAPQTKYNTIYFDIWGDYSGDDYEKTKALHRRYSKWLDRTDSPYMASWMRWHMKDLHFGRY